MAGEDDNDPPRGGYHGFRARTKEEYDRLRREMPWISDRIVLVPESDDTCVPSTYTSSSHHAMAMRRDTDAGHTADGEPVPITETPVDLDTSCEPTILKRYSREAMVLFAQRMRRKARR